LFAGVLIIYFVTFFGDVFRWRNDHDVIIVFLKFDFVIISLKKQIWPHHVTSGHQNRRLRDVRGGRKPPAIGDFENLLVK